MENKFKKNAIKIGIYLVSSWLFIMKIKSLPLIKDS